MENAAGRIEIIGGATIHVKEEGQGSGSFFIVLPRTAIHNRKTQLKLELYNGDTRIDVVKTNFLGPIYN
jgi:ribosomal protein S28E/S33